jgi:hypothetical protein
MISLRITVRFRIMGQIVTIDEVVRGGRGEGRGEERRGGEGSRGREGRGRGGRGRGRRGRRGGSVK